MPSFTWSQALTANQLGFDPLSNWQFRYVPYRSLVQIWPRATGTSVRLTVYAGTTTIQQRAPVQGGGTAGTTPTSFTTEAIEFVAMPGDLLLLQHDEVGGVTPTVDGIIKINPV